MPTALQKQSKVRVRLANADEGSAIHNLFIDSGKWEIEGIDWTADPRPYWLMAEYDGVLAGCIMVRPGRPIGNLELLCIPVTFAHRVKAVVAHQLLLAGLYSLKRAGAQVVVGFIHGGLENFARVLERRGAVKWFDGTAYIIRV